MTDLRAIRKWIGTMPKSVTDALPNSLSIAATLALMPYSTCSYCMQNLLARRIHDEQKYSRTVRESTLSTRSIIMMSKVHILIDILLCEVANTESRPYHHIRAVVDL